MRLVIDASVAIKWYVREDHSETALTLINEEIDLHAPQLLIAEIGNVLWAKARSGDLQQDQAIRIADALLRRQITYHSLSELLKKGLTHAVRSSIPIYDRMYLTLAQQLECRYVTADRRFFLAARRSNAKSTVMWIEELI